jgi:hypothetical protein
MTAAADPDHKGEFITSKLQPNIGVLSFRHARGAHPYMRVGKRLFRFV